MRRLCLLFAAAVAFSAPALAQQYGPPGGGPSPSYAPPPPAAVNPAPQPPPPPTRSGSAGRPGHEPGVGESQPFSNRASNITPSDTRSTIAPTLPSPPVPPDSGPREYLQAARGALARGQTGETQQALEMAETRALDRSVPYLQTNSVDRSPLVTQINQALQQLGAGDRAGAMQAIEAAIPLASQ